MAATRIYYSAINQHVCLLLVSNAAKNFHASFLALAGPSCHVSIFPDLHVYIIM